MAKRYAPKALTNYTPFFKPAPPITIDNICDDDKIVSVCFALELLPYVIGALENLHWDDRFTGTLEQRQHSVGLIQDLVQAMMKGIRNMGECGCCDTTIEQIRQLMVVQNTVYNGQLAAQYDGTPESVAPDIPSNFDGDYDTPYPSNRIEAALCKAVNDMLAQGITQAANDLNQASAAIGFLTGVVGLINPVAGVIVGVLWAFTSSELQEAMSDDLAFKKVVCCILAGLRGKPVSQAALFNATQDSGCTFEGNESVLNSIWETLFVGDETNYLAFIAHYNRAMRNTSDSADSSCECCGLVPDYRFDYKYFGGQYPSANFTPATYEKTAPNQITITTFIGFDPNNVGDTQRGFRIYAPSGCCFRVRMVSPTFVPMPPNQYGLIWINKGSGEPCVTVGPDLDMSQFWCTDNFEMRWWADSKFPQAFPPDTPIVLEFDSDNLCI